MFAVPARPALLTFIVGSALVLASVPAQAAGPRVPTIVLRANGHGGHLELDGTIEPVRQSTVAAQVSGNVVALPVRAGDAVKSGQVLARIDSRETEAGLARSQAEVAQAQAQAANARQQLERTRELKAQGFVSAAALDSAQAQWRAAEAAAAAARAGQSQAALARQFTNVLTPFDGLVLATHVEVGDLAGPGRAIATVYSPEQLRAVVQVPSSHTEAARSAGSIEVEWPTGRATVRPTKIIALPGADPVAQTVEWRLDLPSGTPALPGEAVRVRFTGLTSSNAESQGLRVPATAVLRRGELVAVYVVRNGRFVLQAVRTSGWPALPTADAMITLLAGVKAGDRVAVNAVQAGLADATPEVPR